jgi:hypothetical protein
MDEFNFSSLVLTHALDRRIFMAWLCGASVDEALAAQKLPPYEWPSSAAKKQILSQYRQFEMMEHFLHRPQYFVGPHQFVFPVSLAVKRSLIEMYYQFDHPVVRELLGKKLGSRSRKDLEEICVKTKVSIGSCRRQFDNMKRVMKRTEDLEGSLLLNIRQLFQISPELARYKSY